MAYSPWIFTSIKEIPEGFLDNFDINPIYNKTTHIGYPLKYNSKGTLHEVSFNSSELKDFSKIKELQFLSFEDFKIALFKHKVLNL